MSALDVRKVTEVGQTCTSLYNVDIGTGLLEKIQRMNILNLKPPSKARLLKAHHSDSFGAYRGLATVGQVSDMLPPLSYLDPGSQIISNRNLLELDYIRSLLAIRHPTATLSQTVARLTAKNLGDH